MPIPIGPDFFVNTTRQGQQSQPAIGVIPNGSFLIAWHSTDGGDGSGTAIRARLFLPSGNPASNDTVINTTTANDQWSAAASGLSDGRFFLIWMSNDVDRAKYIIRGRYLDASGHGLGADFVVNSTDRLLQSNPACAALPYGAVVASWSVDEDGDTYMEAVRARLFDQAGNPVAADFVANASLSRYKSNSCVAYIGDDRFLIGWGSREPRDYDVGARPFDTAGQPQGPDAIVNDIKVADQFAPSFAGFRDGGAIAVWYSNDSGDGSGSLIRGRLLDAQGRGIGTDFVVNSTTLQYQYRPKCTALMDGRFVVVWHSEDGGDQSATVVRGRLFQRDAVPIGPDFIVNSVGRGYQSNATVAALEGPRFVVAWESNDSGDYNIRGRLFQA